MMCFFDVQQEVQNIPGVNYKQLGLNDKMQILREITKVTLPKRIHLHLLSHFIVIVSS